MAHTIQSQRLFPSVFKILGYTLLHILEVGSLFFMNISHISTLCLLHFLFQWTSKMCNSPYTYPLFHRHYHWVGWCRLQPSSPEDWVLTRFHRIRRHWAQMASTVLYYLWMRSYLPSTSRTHWSSEAQPTGSRSAWSIGRTDTAVNIVNVLTKTGV